MKCPHCLVEFHPDGGESNLDSDREYKFVIEGNECPKCGRLNYVFRVCHKGGTVLKEYLVYPKSISRTPLPPEVPPQFADDYKEACAVLGDSPKASAALSRRCLQHLFREEAKTKAKNLNDQIDEVINSKTLPSSLSEAIDAVRVLGNFAAHPIKSTNSGAIVEVEPGEAEWSLDTLEGLFDFYFVQPAVLKQKKDALNAKITKAGKPPLK